MPRRLIITVLALSALLTAGCSQQRSRAVNEPPGPGDAKGGERNFREMIERSRTRQKTQDSLEAMQGAMQDAVLRFQRDIGRLPTNIVELVARSYVPRIPDLPAEHQFIYKPDLGIITIEKIASPNSPAFELPPAPELTNRPALSPFPKP